MADLVLAERGPLAHCVIPGRHGRGEGEPGVTLRVRSDVRLITLQGFGAEGGALQRAATQAGLELPPAGRTAAGGGFTVLWAGPDQWIVASARQGHEAAERFVAGCRPHCAVIDQTDGRAVVDVSGPKARAALAKGLPIDLHPRSFQAGMTALTTAAAVAVQVWQTDDAPSYRLLVPRSFAEAFWRWLTAAAAEYGVVTEEGA